MSRPAPRIHELEHHAADRATTRPVVSGTQGLVAAGHPLVAMAGMRMLMAGGNAFDAAAAAGFAAAVVEPTASYTLMGECVALVHEARKGRTQVISGQGTAPALATIETFRKRGHDRIPTGPGADAHLSFTVPGAVDAYLTLLETLGTRTLGAALAPAREYARGFPMYDYMHRMLAIPETRSQFAIYPPGGDAVFYPGGRVPAMGELFVQPALGNTLKRIADGARGARNRVAASGRRASASTGATSRRPSARSPSGWAACFGPRTWPAIAPRSRRRRGSRSWGARSWPRARGPRGRCSCRPSACSPASICARSATIRPATSTW
jgi:hypothetical protein